MAIFNVKVLLSLLLMNSLVSHYWPILALHLLTTLQELMTRVSRLIEDYRQMAMQDVEHSALIEYQTRELVEVKTKSVH